MVVVMSLERSCDTLCSFRFIGSIEIPRHGIETEYRAYARARMQILDPTLETRSLLHITLYVSADFVPISVAGS